MQLSQILNELMLKNNNMSAYKLSKETGISDRLIGYWRKGEKMPNAENIVILATYFGITSDYLLGLSNNPNPQIQMLPTPSTSNLNEQQQELLNNYDIMNARGQQALLSYSGYLAQQPENLKADSEDNQVVS